VFASISAQRLNTHQVSAHKLSCSYLQHEVSSLSRELYPGLARYRFSRRCKVLDVHSQHGPRSCGGSVRRKRSIYRVRFLSYHFSGSSRTMGADILVSFVASRVISIPCCPKYQSLSSLPRHSSNRSVSEQTAEYHHVYRPRQRD